MQSSMANTQSLFDSSTLSQCAVPDGYQVRSLQDDDGKHGYLTILDALVQSDPPLDAATFKSRFHELLQANAIWPSTLVTVITNREGQIVATGTLLVERKFLRTAATAGHIEDIAVRPDQQGKGLGRVLINALTDLARHHGCYKVILDCEERNVKFYENCDYIQAGVEMKRYLR